MRHTHLFESACDRGVFEEACLRCRDDFLAGFSLGDLAYQTYGSGELDILVAPGFVSHVERAWEHPSCRAFLVSLMTLGRLILFDRRDMSLHLED